MQNQITGIVLAGGQARRMGGVDKGLISLCGRPMVEWTIRALRPQVETIAINANRNSDLYAGFGYAVVADNDSGFLGPLAGMASGMRAARTTHILTVPCDSPLIVPDLAERLWQCYLSKGPRCASLMTENVCSRFSRCSRQRCLTAWRRISAVVGEK